MNTLLEALRDYFAPVIWCWRALRRAAAWLKFRLFVIFHRRRPQLASGVITMTGAGRFGFESGMVLQTSDGQRFVAGRVEHSELETKVHVASVGPGPVEFYGSGARVDVGDE